MRRSVWVAVTALLASIAGGASAIPVTMSFQVPGKGMSDPFATPVSGTIVWEAESLGAPIKGLKSIDLTIAGYTYTLGEVDFMSPFIDPIDLIGSGADIVGVYATGDDFVLQFDRTTLTPRLFWYASSQAPGQIYEAYGEAYGATGFTSFSVTANAVPEPGTLALLGVAFAGIGFARLRRRG